MNTRRGFISTTQESPARSTFQIQCAICGKPVDRVLEERPFDRQVIRLTAICHGDSESAEIPYSVLLRMNSMSDIEFRPAFFVKRIADEAQQITSPPQA